MAKGYDVTCLCGGFMSDNTLRVGLDVDGDEGELIFKKGGSFERWIADPMKLSGGRTVGEENRHTMHRLLDAWLDGREFEV